MKLKKIFVTALVSVLALGNVMIFTQKSSAAVEQTSLASVLNINEALGEESKSINGYIKIEHHYHKSILWGLFEKDEDNKIEGKVDYDSFSNNGITDRDKNDYSSYFDLGKWSFKEPDNYVER